jgi:hypothetical protein
VAVQPARTCLLGRHWRGPGDRLPLSDRLESPISRVVA